MSEHHSAASAPKLAPSDPDAVSADPALVLKVQRAAQIANENCDRAMALAHKLSAELRKAQSRINHLEREADELVHQQRMEAETVVAKLQSDADASVDRVKAEADRRIERIKSEADKRVASAEANANEHLSRVRVEVETLKADLVQAECRADRAEQWLVVIRREIEDRLMPSFTDMHDRLPPPEGD